jgi:hypothetical protein
LTSQKTTGKFSGGFLRFGPHVFRDLIANIAAHFFNGLACSMGWHAPCLSIMKVISGENRNRR